ncbi:trophozoite exported protein 1 [Plasmodium gaboni]|uniref:Trophozoite exported protein 1 n=1 Tax=Plasmodium gaboni TaxID=647221 RepID=A0ABY1UJ64_9APIC|nr:trophozoite exported protein 1 [Plasmodium gaboni]
MSNKKRSKNENDESTSLPLENSELLIEYIHNLKNCLNVYRREIQEKNKYISIIKNDLSFHECMLTNVNVVWSVFNNDLLNFICNNEKKEENEEGEDTQKKRNIGDEINEYNNIIKLQNDEHIKDNNVIKEDLEDEANQKFLMKSPYYNIENFLQVFLKYINKKKKKKKVKDEGKKEKNEEKKNEYDEEEEDEEDEEEEENENKEDEEFFKTFVSFDLYHNENEKNIFYDKNLVKREKDNMDDAPRNNNMCDSDNKCDNYDIYNEGREMLDQVKSYSGDEKVNRSDNAKSYDYVKNKSEEKEEKKNVVNNKKRSLECNPNEVKRICSSLEEKIGTVESAKVKEYNELDNEKAEKNQNDDNTICNYLSNNKGENIMEKEDKSYYKMNNKNYTNEEDKKTKQINLDYLKKKIKCNQDLFEETIQKCFLINLKKTLNLINQIMYLKNVEFRKYNLDYIRKINYEKCFYYKNYVEIKKKINELKKDNESLKIQVDRLEKKKATLIYKLNNDNIRKHILDDNIKNYQNSIDNRKVSYFEEGDSSYKRNNKNDLTDNDNSDDDNNNDNSDDNYNSEDNENNNRNYKFHNKHKKDSLNEDGVKKNCLNVCHKINSDSNIFVHVENIITKQNIIHSEPFRNLLKESNELYIILKEKEKENIILKNEILKMENKKDEEYEQLLNSTIEDKKELTRSIKELEVNMMTCNMEKDKISNKVNTLEYEINVLKNIDKNQTMQLQQKESDILKMKLYIEKLKLSEKNLKDKIILLENEKDKKILSPVNMIDNSFNDGSICEEGGRTHLTDIQNDSNDKKRFNELFIENQKLKEELNKKKNVEEELCSLKKNYNIINEEIEEITKEFEKKQEQVDEMILQIKNKELELLDKFNNKINKAYVEEKLKELKNTYEEKMKHINNIYKKHDDFVNIYLNLFFQARKNTVLSDSQREEQMNLFIKLKDKYDIIFQKKIELTDILKNVYDCNKKLIGHCQDLEKENSTLQNKLSNEIKNSKMLSKNLSKNSDDHLLIEENNELRRRLICSVCMENFRNYIIIKCGHIYCNNCIFNNLKTRNRKCPQCKVPFDKKDLQKIFLD